jgi:hypothetical protein
MASGGDEMRRKSEASDEIWKSGYNLKPTKERSDETRSGESRGIAASGNAVPWQRHLKKLRAVSLKMISCGPKHVAEGLNYFQVHMRAEIMRMVRA